MIEINDIQREKIIGGINGWGRMLSGPVCDPERGKWGEFSGNSKPRSNSRKCRKSWRQVCFLLNFFFFQTFFFQKRNAQLGQNVCLDNNYHSIITMPLMQTRTKNYLTCTFMQYLMFTSNQWHCLPANWHFSFPGMLLSSPRFSKIDNNKK